MLRCPDCYRRLNRIDDDTADEALSRHRLIDGCKPALVAVTEVEPRKSVRPERQTLDVPDEVRTLRQAYTRAKRNGEPVTDEMVAANREFARLRYAQLPDEKKPKPRKRSKASRLAERERKARRDGAYMKALLALAEAHPEEFRALHQQALASA